jgi:hypothetical protein
LAVVMSEFPWGVWLPRSERRFVGLAGADAHRVFQAEHENFAAADFTGLGRPDDGLGDFVHLVTATSILSLGRQLAVYSVTAIDFGVPLLAAVPFGSVSPWTPTRIGASRISSSLKRF